MFSGILPHAIKVNITPLSGNNLRVFGGMLGKTFYNGIDRIRSASGCQYTQKDWERHLKVCIQLYAYPYACAYGSHHLKAQVGVLEVTARQFILLFGRA